MGGENENREIECECRTRQSRLETVGEEGLK